jgi:hypothetical protein
MIPLVASLGSVSSNKNKIVSSGLVLYLDSKNTRSYISGSTWTDLSSSALNATGNSSFINASTGIRSGATWTTASTSILNDDTHSIFFMIRFNSTGTYPNGWSGAWDKLFSFNPPGSDRSPSVWRYPTQRLLHWRFDPGNTGADFGTTSATGSDFALNTWYYVGVTKNGATALSYVNGVQVASQAVANPKTSGSSSVILNEAYTADLNNINCITVYNRVLTANEINQNYNAFRDRFGM